MKEIKLQASPNIALIKYWGKKETSGDENKNTPLNPSISLTLSKAKTEITLKESSKTQIILQGKAAPEKDIEKISAHIQRIENYLGKTLSPFAMNSSNNFPMGTGIASSASAFAAMTCAFLAWELGVDDVKKLLSDNPNVIADLARRGSGSACRSLHGPFVEWNEKSIHVHKSDWKLFDTIVIFSSKEKKVSSTEGHKFATQSPLFPKRLQTLPARLQLIKEAITKKSLKDLGPLIETEAEEMHQIMRENPTPIEYQLPETKLFLKHLTKQNRDFFYTLDAGPNAHIISERPIKDEISKLLSDLNLEAEIWEDSVGYGPQFFN